ncbi:MAG: hypothetical protein QF483_03195 [Gammaproteobacteria bacterium]|nr:hypothetical protein [Gammaproteobacteria bacterium]MDP7153612.1 hypothetical protein [Gammaproteobacteria bacterium]MDP7296924.1 hypothetical protein [Gammaproteobacteria bacterium]MDP7418869.1 hypothetical protein [Gammaproteobacteria bacterium]MDP7659775.1 hypothetical protein [Gammaproteobacteria bacterium]
MVRQKCLAFLTVIALSALSTAFAESLVIENIDQSSAALMVRPNRGMSMDTVESKWGKPVIKQASVGDPPISRWEYSSFIVYFEYRSVIHTVVKN